jgi:hypothetical protein
LNFQLFFFTRRDSKYSEANGGETKSKVPDCNFNRLKKFLDSMRCLIFGNEAATDHIVAVIKYGTLSWRNSSNRAHEKLLSCVNRLLQRTGCALVFVTDAGDCFNMFTL